MCRNKRFREAENWAMSLVRWTIVHILDELYGVSLRAQYTYILSSGNINSYVWHRDSCIWSVWTLHKWCLVRESCEDCVSWLCENCVISSTSWYGVTMGRHAIALCSDKLTNLDNRWATLTAWLLRLGRTFLNRLPVYASLDNTCHLTSYNYIMAGWTKPNLIEKSFANVIELTSVSACPVFMTPVIDSLKAIKC
jgi:hypothetical protein